MRRRIPLPILIIIIIAAAWAVLFVSLLNFHSQSGIRFEASLNVTSVAPGEVVSVRITDWNTLDIDNTMPSSAVLASRNLSSGPCGGSFPGGIAVYEGTYGANNVSSATPLPFYAHGSGIDCGTTSSSPINLGPQENLSTSFDISGYYTSGSTAGILHDYAPGVYTVIAGDSLGHTKVMYFRVTAPKVGAASRAHHARDAPAESEPDDSTAGVCQVHRVSLERLTRIYIGRGPD